MLDIEDGDAFPHILIENECLHVTRRLIWSFCTMRRASRTGVVLCERCFCARRGAAARDTTSQQGPVWDPAGCHGERRETRNCGPRGEAG